MFKFKGNIYNTEAELEDAVYDYAERTFDDYLDSEYGQVNLMDDWYNTSEVLKKLKIGKYKWLLSDYYYSLFDEVEEI